jgi:hypothetical protein
LAKNSAASPAAKRLRKTAATSQRIERAAIAGAGPIARTVDFQRFPRRQQSLNRAVAPVKHKNQRGIAVVRIGLTKRSGFLKMR